VLLALAVNRRAGRIEPVDHLVFMGMGEPLMNLDHVLAASRRLPDVGITHRRTGISTVGWVPGIERLTETDMPIRLALSLHAPDDATQFGQRVTLEIDAPRILRRQVGLDPERAVDPLLGAADGLPLFESILQRVAV